MNNCDITTFSTITTSDESKINVFLDIIKSLTNDDSTNWLKWKDTTEQVVIKTTDQYFKIYQETYVQNWFKSLIRQTIANVYTQLGVNWIFSVKREGDIFYHIEQRECLPVCGIDVDITIDEVLLGWRTTLDLIEEKLNFDMLLIQMRQYIPSLYKIKLIRDAHNCLQDYAIKDNHIFLLDDADFFLALVNEEGDLIDIQSPFYNLLYPEIGEVTLTTNNFFAGEIIERMADVNSKVNRFWLYDISSTTMKKHYDLLKHGYESHIRSNIKLLSGVTDKLPTNDPLKQITN